MDQNSSAAAVRSHVVITGTGRAGTTFLIQLLTHLGLDTGFVPGHLELAPIARAGLEIPFWLQESSPRIVKSPHFCDMPTKFLASQSIRIEHAIIPVRRFEAAAMSRVYVQEQTTGRKNGAPVIGGLWDTETATDQETILRRKFTRLIEMLVSVDVPMTFLMFPRLVRDVDYLYGKLRFLLDDIDLDAFRATFQALVRPDWVHQFSEDDR